MSYLSKVGSFNIDTSKTAGQTQAITGVGFEPKIVLFWWGGSTGTGDGVAGGNISLGIGASNGATHFCLIGVSEDAQADSDTRRWMNLTALIRIYTNTDTLDGAITSATMNADGFSLLVGDQFSQTYRISYLALGGTDLTNTYIGNTTTPTVTGNYSRTGVGFQPDCLLTFNTSDIGIINSSSLRLGFGMATGSANQGSVVTRHDDALATSDTKGYGYNGEVISGGTLSPRDAFVSFDADGFTLNHLAGTSAYYYIYIALKGGQYKVHELTTRTDGNDIVESDVGFQPVAILFASANRALSTQGVSTDHNRMSIGAATSATERAAIAVSDEDNLSDTETAYANYDAAVYAHVVDDAVVGLMDIKSIDATGFTAVMDDTDPSACWVMYLAIGAVSSGVSGALSATLDGIGISAGGTVTVVGGLAKTLDGITPTASGTILIQGSSGITLEGIGASGAGVVPVAGVLTATLGEVFITATGTALANGALSQTLDTIGLSSSGKAAVTGSASIQLDTIGIVSTGIGPARGILSVMLEDLGLSAIGILAIVGVANITLGGISLITFTPTDYQGPGRRPLYEVFSERVISYPAKVTMYVKR
jgi:hypothetical protein